MRVLQAGRQDGGRRPGLGVMSGQGSQCLAGEQRGVPGQHHHGVRIVGDLGQRLPDRVASAAHRLLHGGAGARMPIL